MPMVLIKELEEEHDEHPGYQFSVASVSAAKKRATAFAGWDDTWLIVESMQGERIAHRPPGGEWVDAEGPQTMTPAERQRKRRARLKAEKLAKV